MWDGMRTIKIAMQSEAGHWVCGYEVGHVLTIYTVALGGVTTQATQEESGLFVSEKEGSDARVGMVCAEQMCLLFAN